jgi:heme/copper-type cytochrome/quinol oxidase subunit 3
VFTNLKLFPNYVKLKTRDHKTQCERTKAEFACPDIFWHVIDLKGAGIG